MSATFAALILGAAVGLILSLAGAPLWAIVATCVILGAVIGMTS